MTIFHPPRDITAVERVFRWFFSVPQWIQVTGVVLAFVLGVTATVIVWRQRRPLLEFARHRHLGDVDGVEGWARESSR